MIPASSQFGATDAGVGQRHEAEMLFRDRQWAAALDRYRVAAQCYADGPHPEKHAACIRMMVACLLPLGRYSEALGLGYEGLALLRRVQDRRGEALLLEDLAHALSVVGDFAGLKEAIGYLAQAERIYDVRGEQADRCRAVSRQALVHERMFLLTTTGSRDAGSASLAECERSVEEALRLLYSASLSLDPGTMQLQELRLLATLARCRYHQRRWRSAADRFAQAEEKALTVNAVFVGDLAMSAHCLFRLSRDLQESNPDRLRLLAKAMQNIDIATKHCAKLGDFEEVVQTFAIRGDINWELGNRLEAARDYELAFQLIDKRPFLFSRPLDRIATFRQYRHLYPRIVEAYFRAATELRQTPDRFIERAFHYSERARAAALSDLLTLSNELLAKLPEALRAEVQAAEREQREAYLHNESLIHAPEDDQYREPVRSRLWAAEEQLRQVHDRVISELPSLASLASHRHFSMAEVSAALPADGHIGVLQLAVTETCLCAFLITKQKPTVNTCFSLDLGREELERQFAPFFDNYEKFARASKECADLAARLRASNDGEVADVLRARLFQAEQRQDSSKRKWIKGLSAVVPKARHMLFEARSKSKDGRSLPDVVKASGITHLVIVPDGPLQRVPFHAGMHDLAAVTYAPSSSILLRTVERLAGQPASVLLVDNPDATLHEASFEASLVANRLSNAGIRLHRISRTDATPEAVLSQMPNYAFLHYCGHAISDLAAPWDFRLELANPDPGSTDHGDQSGTRLLTARELMIRGAVQGGAVAAVNGCSSGVVPADAVGEFVGLPAAFLAAGYAMVISTLCEVPANTPAVLMDLFFENLLDQRLGHAAALREAAIFLKNMSWDSFRAYCERRASESGLSSRSQAVTSMITSRPEQWQPSHPIHWAPFVIWGAAWTASEMPPRSSAPVPDAPQFNLMLPILSGASPALLGALKNACASEMAGRYVEAIGAFEHILRK